MAPTLPPTCINGFAKPLRLSVIGKPVDCNAVKTSFTVALGLADFISAQTPATWGVAIDVPLAVPKPPPIMEE